MRTELFSKCKIAASLCAFLSTNTCFASESSENLWGDLHSELQFQIASHLNVEDYANLAMASKNIRTNIAGAIERRLNIKKTHFVRDGDTIYVSHFCNLPEFKYPSNRALGYKDSYFIDVPEIEDKPLIQWIKEAQQKRDYAKFYGYKLNLIFQNVSDQNFTKIPFIKDAYYDIHFLNCVPHQFTALKHFAQHNFQLKTLTMDQPFWQEQHDDSKVFDCRNSALLKSFPSLTSLRYRLSFIDHCLKDLPKQQNTYMWVLTQACPQLRHLDLNAWHYLDYKGGLQSLLRLSKLESLHLCTPSPLKDDYIQALAKTMPNLKALKLSMFNTIKSSGFAMLVSFNKLNSLSLACLGSKTAAVSLDDTTLSFMLHNMTQLRHFSAHFVSRESVETVKKVTKKNLYKTPEWMKKTPEIFFTQAAFIDHILPNMMSIHFENYPMTPEMLWTLIDSCPNLTQLSLKNCTYLHEDVLNSTKDLRPKLDVIQRNNY